MENYKCGYCKKTFSTRESLQEHMESCERKVLPDAKDSPIDPPPKDRVYECPKCGATFTKKESFIMHGANCT